LARAGRFPAVILCRLRRQVRGLIHAAKNSTTAMNLSVLLSDRRLLISVPVGNAQCPKIVARG